MSYSLNALTNLHQLGQYGNHLNALVWLAITATLMYVGPATYSLIYLLLYDRPQAGEESIVDIQEEQAEERKAA
jgi:hypothetical protein